jgi:5-methyltetrahydropteroyltriglutamate--homocysteine methyltransferase
MPLPLFPTSLVGSYAQPEWLIDRKKLAGRFPPRGACQGVVAGRARIA